jgi:Skp family chaperone for outer membrane proteins
MLKCVIAGIALWSTATSVAFAYCSEPSAPYCATSFGDFADQFEFDMCKSEMERYQNDVERHLQCLNEDLQTEVRSLQEDAQRESDTALSAYSDAVDDFNRRAGN